MEKYSKFIDMFISLGNSWSLTNENLDILEEFICYLYGHKCKTINTARYNKFKDAYEKKNKIQDLSLLPPCQQTLRLYFKRSNYVARIWKLCLIPRVCLPAVEDHGWKYSLVWLCVTRKYCRNITCSWQWYWKWCTQRKWIWNWRWVNSFSANHMINIVSNFSCLVFNFDVFCLCHSLQMPSYVGGGKVYTHPTGRIF